jgi:membrane-associated protein
LPPNDTWTWRCDTATSFCGGAGGAFDVTVWPLLLAGIGMLAGSGLATVALVGNTVLRSGDPDWQAREPDPVERGMPAEITPQPAPRAVPRGRRRAQPAAVALVGLGGLVLLAVLLLWEGDDLLELLQPLRATAASILARYGRPAAFALLYLEESGLPLGVPGDIYVMYVGHRSAGQPLVWLATWLGLIACVLLGASNLYLISRRWGHRLLVGRLGQLLHLDRQRLERGERWFARWGIWAIIFGRHVPGLRVPITVAAGMLEVRYPVFAVGVVVSTAVWAAFFMIVGGTVADGIQALTLHRRALLIAAAVALVLVVVATTWMRFRGRAVSIEDKS